MAESLEQSIVALGLEIFRELNTEKEDLFDKNYWFGRMMEWVTKDPSFKVDLFRFVDVLPMLTTNDQVAKHIKEYLLKKDRDIPIVMNTALKAASLSLTKGLFASAIRKNVTEMAQRFIAGRDIRDAKNLLTPLYDQGFTFTVDLLGEKTLSHVEADSYLSRYMELIEVLPNLFQRKVDADLPNISIKASALSSDLREEDPKTSVDEVKKRVLPLLRAAKSKNVFINFDVESFQTCEIIYLLFSDIALSDEFRSWPHLGIVAQAYLRSAERHVNDLIDLCRQRQTPITLRLVKGAYWDYEVVKAQSLGHEVPVFLNKAETDINYEHLSRVLLDHSSIIRSAFGSHNIRSLAHAIAYAETKSIKKTNYEIQMLYGMANAERKVLLNRGHRVRIYVPIGEILPGMSYLVRRLLENTSQMGFLKLRHHDHKNESILLKTPTINQSPPKKHDGFLNASRADYTDPHIRSDFLSAISSAKNALPIDVPITIDGVAYSTKRTVDRMSPNDPSKKIATISLATIEQAEQAIETSFFATKSLANLGVDKRADQLLALADILAADRFIISAFMCFEVGKTWAEADADVAEAIDFCRYYAERARDELSPKKMGTIDGEHNLLTFIGRGPTIVIAPWNFPLAILCGMSVAAYVAGNPIIMKPSEQSSLIGRMLFDRMIKANFLSNAVQFLPGVGEEIGPHLVSHRKVANICFTGSMKVGHEIMRTANTVVKDQIEMKHVICEMGGKNAVVIDEDADLDEAVNGTIISAFGYAGQKCSAASRVIVVGTIKDQFLSRLIDAVNSIRLGPSTEPSTFMGPVVDKDAFLRLNMMQEKLGRDTSVKVLQKGTKPSRGYFVPPMIVLVENPDHWVMQDELFGPILAIFCATDLKHAIDVANNTKYALTGALFSRSPTNISYACEEWAVGNLYVNQKCTGAIVARQPFGGFKMSGTGIKAGGPHYLLNLVNTKLVSENTMRRGFTPESQF